MFLPTNFIFLGGLGIHLASALTIPDDIELSTPQEEKRAVIKYSFNQVVVFGDEFCDNGNGSYAHGITGAQPKNYGFGTWTDGPIAASYLTSLLNMPQRNLAWGGCCGGSSSGATIDNAYTAAEASWNGAPVPSLHDQIYNNYTKSGIPSTIKTSLHFLWAGQNDLNKHTDAFWSGDPKNAQFAANFSSRVVADAEYLVSNGAPLVMVANIYPKHLAPVTKKYLCTGTSAASCVTTWGNEISQANTALKNAVAASKYKSKIMYYDVFGFMTTLMTNKNSYGLTQSLSDFCDGDGEANWQACLSGAQFWDGAKAYFWMNYIQPTTRVHQLIGIDMKAALDVFVAAGLTA